MNSGFMGQNLLGSQSHSNRGFGGQTKGLIHRIGMKTLAAAKNTRHRLVGHSDNIVQWLLLRE